MYESGEIYSEADLRYDYDHGADVLFDYDGISYGLFFFLVIDGDDITGCDIFIGPSGKHKTKKYTDPDALLNEYRMHDGATLSRALPDVRLTHHS